MDVAVQQSCKRTCSQLDRILCLALKIFHCQLPTHPPIHRNGQNIQQNSRHPANTLLKNTLYEKDSKRPIKNVNQLFPLQHRLQILLRESKKKSKKKKHLTYFALDLPL
jgi:hypothetical protein